MSKSSNIASGGIAIDRNRERLGSGPSEFKPFAQRADPHSALSRPFSHSLNAPFEAQSPVTSRVIALLGRSGPTAILRAVAEAVVNPFQRVVIGWSRPHIGKKINCGLPSFAHRYSASAVVLKFEIILIFTAVHHVSPRRIFRRFNLAVDRLSRALKFLLIASTRHACSVPQALTTHDLFVSAIASAQPTKGCRSAFSVLVSNPVMQRYDRPAPEALACNVLYWHGPIVAQNRR